MDKRALYIHKEGGDCHKDKSRPPEVQRFGYKGMDKRSKDRIPRKNIETDTVDTVKTKILGDPPNATKLWFLYQPLQVVHKPVKEHKEERYQCLLCYHHYCKEEA
eukprot:14392587-Ditylum_brightwellii.AAC.1